MYLNLHLNIKSFLASYKKMTLKAIVCQPLYHDTFYSCERNILSIVMFFFCPALAKSQKR